MRMIHQDLDDVALLELQITQKAFQITVAMSQIGFIHALWITVGIILS